MIRAFGRSCWVPALVGGFTFALAVLATGTDGAQPPARTLASGQTRAVTANQGRYLYMSSNQMNASVSRGCTELVPDYRQRWIAADGSGLIRDTTGLSSFPSARDRASCKKIPGGDGPGVATSDLWAARGCFSIEPVNRRRLPRNASRLRSDLLTGKVEGGPPGPGEAFVQVGDLLRDGAPSPQLSAELYSAAAGLHGVERLGTVTDRAGRHGLGLEIISRGLRRELILDPHTHELLGEQETVVSSRSGWNVPLGTVIGWAAYLHREYVATLPTGGPPNPQPPCIHGAGRIIPGPDGSSVQVGASTPRAR